MLSERILSRIEIGPVPDFAPELGQCWLWTGQLNTGGYARLGGGLAHQQTWTALVGPIPEGLVFDHLCRVRRCVCPRHLEPVTNPENLRRGIHPLKTHCKHGHEFTDENTGWQRAGRYCRTCKRLREQRRYRLAKSYTSV